MPGLGMMGAVARVVRKTAKRAVRKTVSKGKGGAQRMYMKAGKSASATRRGAGKRQVKAKGFIQKLVNRRKAGK